MSSPFLTPAGSFTSVSPAGSFTSRYPQTGTYLDGFEAPSSPRYSFTDPITANMGGPVTFEAPELPEETLMEVRRRFYAQLWKVVSRGKVVSSIYVCSNDSFCCVHQSGVHCHKISKCRIPPESVECEKNRKGERSVVEESLV